MSPNRWVPRNPLAQFSKAIRSAPRESIYSPPMLFSALLYATSAIPLSWDQGSAATISSLDSFEQNFGISSGSNANEIKLIVSIVYIGDAAGAALSLFINDKVGRRWSYRIYTCVWIIGYLIAMFSSSVGGLYASRVISGLGIGALSVTGNISIAEIAPPEIRGLLTAWYTVFQLLALMCSIFCVYGVQLHLAPTPLQYQVVWFAPCIFMFLCIIGTFFVPESPRWLVLSNQPEKAQNALIELRRLPATHPRVLEELQSIVESTRAGSELDGEDSQAHTNTLGSLKEILTKKSNLRRLQQVIILYAFPQLSGGNSITNYFVPFLEIVGAYKNATHGLFLSGMYAMSKFFFSLITSFLLIDAIGRRGSLFLGISVQMLSYIYLAAYIKSEQNGNASAAAGDAGLAALFTAAFGYTAGLLTLPYVLGSELWPNRIRSTAAAIGQTFHWLFHFSMTYAVPSLLARTNNWGGFVFFAVWCLVALLYVYLFMPEVAGLSVEEIEHVFSGPVIVGKWHRSKRDRGLVVVNGQDVDLVPYADPMAPTIDLNADVKSQGGEAK